jgi:hypothetical protein
MNCDKNDVNKICISFFERDEFRSSSSSCEEEKMRESCEWEDVVISQLQHTQFYLFLDKIFDIATRRLKLNTKEKVLILTQLLDPQFLRTTWTIII